MDVDEEVFALEVCPGEVEEEGAEGEVDFGVVRSIETIDELAVVLDFLLVLVVPLLILRVRFDDLLTDDFRFIHQVQEVILAMRLRILGK